MKRRLTGKPLNGFNKSSHLESNRCYKTNAANTEKKVPAEWILPEHKGLSQEFVDYCLPLIQGDPKCTLEDGLPRFAHLKKVYVKK